MNNSLKKIHNSQDLKKQNLKNKSKKVIQKQAAVII
jgi:hypothetical protein